MNLSVLDHPAPAEAHDAQPTNSRNCNNTSAASNQDAAEREDSKIIINNIDTASVITHPRHRHDPDLDSIAYQVRSPEHQKPVDHLGPNDRSSLYPCRPVHKSQPQPPSQLVIATEILAQSSTAVRPTEEYERLPASFLAVRPSPQKFWGLPGPGPIHFAPSHDADPYGFLRFGRTSSAGEASSDGNHLSNPAGEIRADRGLGMGSDSVLLQNLDAAYVHYAGQFVWPPEASAAGTAYGGASALPYWQPCIYPVPPPPIYTPALRERGYYIGRFDQYSDVRSPGTSGNQARLLAPTATIARYGNVAPRSSAPGPTATSSRDYQTNADSSLPGQENHTLNAFNRAIPRLSLPTQPTRTPAAQDLSQDRAPYAEPHLRNQFPAFSPNFHPDAHTELGSMVRHSGYDERFPTTHVGRSANVPNVASTPDYQVYEPRPNSGYNITSSRANSGVTSEQRRAKHRHQCDMCEKSYPKPYQLRDHKVKHTGGPKPYPCGFGRCSAAFTTRSNMRKHFNREHCSGGSSQIALESTSKPARLETVEETAVAGPSARVPVFGADDQHSGQFVSRSDDATIKKYARFRRRG